MDDTSHDICCRPPTAASSSNTTTFRSASGPSSSSSSPKMEPSVEVLCTIEVVSPSPRMPSRRLLHRVVCFVHRWHTSLAQHDWPAHDPAMYIDACISYSLIE